MSNKLFVVIFLIWWWKYFLIDRQKFPLNKYKDLHNYVTCYHKYLSFFPKHKNVVPIKLQCDVKIEMAFQKHLANYKIENFNYPW
jgi:hypothetical protein